MGTKLQNDNAPTIINQHTGTGTYHTNLSEPHSDKRITSYFIIWCGLYKYPVRLFLTVIRTIVV